MNFGEFMRAIFIMIALLCMVACPPLLVGVVVLVLCYYIFK